MALALPAPPVATSFANLFNDMSKDPFLADGNYEDFLAPFNINNARGQNDTPEAVRNQLAAATNQRLPITVLLLVEGQLQPYFLPSAVSMPWGQPPTQRPMESSLPTMEN